MGLSDLFKTRTTEQVKVIIDPARKNPYNAAQKLIENMEGHLADDAVLTRGERELAMARLVV